MTNTELASRITELEKNFARLYQHVQAVDRRLAQLEFAVTNGLSASPSRSAAEITKAKGNPGGSGGDFV